jgi:hypothetical protein
LLIDWNAIRRMDRMLDVVEKHQEAYDVPTKRSAKPLKNFARRGLRSPD